jgi:glycosyltransferase involved in cell wall biosynthesis
VDTDQFKPIKVLENNLQSILYVGRIDRTSRWKGIEYLFNAFLLVIKEFPTARLSVVGDGDDLDIQINTVKKLGIKDNIDFLGPLKGNDLTKIYQKSNLLVLPSTTESESFGMVLIEAMACSKPVVGSNVGGIPFVIDDNVTGLIVQPKNSVELAKAISNILKNPILGKVMGENGYRKVKENFTWEKKVAETNAVILEVLKK